MIIRGLFVGYLNRVPIHVLVYLRADEVHDLVAGNRDGVVGHYLEELQVPVDPLAYRLLRDVRDTPLERLDELLFRLLRINRDRLISPVH